MNASGNYSPRPWMQDVPMNMPAPANTYEAFATQTALAPVTGELTHDEIQNMPNSLNIDRFPPRFGYRTEEIGITDVARLDDLYERTDFSGKRSGYSGTSMPALSGGF